MGKPRQTMLTIVLGYNGTGKTTFVSKLVKNELAGPRRRALIITPDDREWNSVPYFNLRFPDRLGKFTGVRKIIAQKNTIDIIRDHFYGGLLIFDDCRGYMKSYTDDDLHYLLIRRRQKEMDMVAVGHGFTEVPPKFFTFCSNIVLFQTKDNIYKRRDDLRNFEEMVQHQNRINKIAQQNKHYYEIIPT